MAAPSAPASDRVLTIPNVITAARLACVPLFWWILLGNDDRAAAAVLLALLGCTDWVDGYIARRFDQVSELGKVLDPVADRVLFIGCLTAIFLDGGVPRWLCVVVVARELVVGGMMVVATAFGMQRFDVQWTGKAGTFGLMIAFPLLLLGASDVGFHEVYTVLGWCAAVPGLVFSFWSAVTYVPRVRAALAEGRKARGR